MKNYLLRHLQVLFYTLGQLAATPLATLMTVAVIGITLALPAGLYTLLANVERLAGNWDSGAQLSLFLKKDLSENRIQALAGQLRQRPDIGGVEYISRSQALAEFRRSSGFGEALDALGDNPLPAVLVVRPAPGHNDPAALDALTHELGALPGVDLAQLDLEWVRRLQALVHIGQRGLVLLAATLALAVLLILGNTIRMAVLNRRAEIEVITLIGGTDTFIRRPFLYSGTLQGALGALTAWLLVEIGVALLDGPVTGLLTLYGSSARLVSLSAADLLALVAAGALLGWLGARIAVQRHLRDLRPG